MLKTVENIQRRKYRAFMIWPCLFCIAFFWACPGQLLVYAICIEGSHENPKKKVALASPGKRYVRFLEMCYNPIGKDDTRGSDVWGLYRDGLYRRKKSKKIEDPRYRQIIENEKKM